MASLDSQNQAYFGREGGKKNEEERHCKASITPKKDPPGTSRGYTGKIDSHQIKQKGNDVVERESERALEEKRGREGPWPIRLHAKRSVVVLDSAQVSIAYLGP